MAVVGVEPAIAVEFASVAEARAHLKDLLDAAAEGRPARLRRDNHQIALVDAEQLRRSLSALAARAEVVSDQGAWSVFIPGTPIAADGASFDQAIDEMAMALREYATDWVDHLHRAHNHAGNWGLVQLVALSDDQQLAAWLTGDAPI